MSNQHVTPPILGYRPSESTGIIDIYGGVKWGYQVLAARS